MKPILSADLLLEPFNTHPRARYLAETGFVSIGDGFVRNSATINFHGEVLRPASIFTSGGTINLNNVNSSFSGPVAALGFGTIHTVSIANPGTNSAIGAGSAINIKRNGGYLNLVGAAVGPQTSD